MIPLVDFSPCIPNSSPRTVEKFQKLPKKAVYVRFLLR